MGAGQSADEMLETLFIHTVQGCALPESCIVVGGALARSDQPIPEKTKPNLALLALYLRTSPDISERLRDWGVTLFRPTRPEPLPHKNDLHPWEPGWKPLAHSGEATEIEKEAPFKGLRYDRGDAAVACRVKAIERRKRGNPKSARYAHWIESLPAETRQRMIAVKQKLADSLAVDDFTLLYLTLKDRPLSPDDRAWLADVFDPASSFDFQIKEIVRRRSGRKQGKDTLSSPKRKAAKQIEAGIAEDKQKPRAKRAGRKRIIHAVATGFDKSDAWGADSLSHTRTIKRVGRKTHEKQ